VFVFKAAVLGAGTMGGEIAQVIASADVPVVMKDVKQEFIDAGLTKAREVTEGQLASLVKKEKLTQEQADERREEILGRITGTTEYAGFGDADFVIEAVPERMEIKQAVFAELDEVTPGHAILASNTSALSISEIESAEVLDARIACPGVTSSSSAKTACLISIRSGTASITKSASPKPSYSVVPVIRPRISSRRSSACS